MAYCKKCGAQHEDGLSYCPACAAPTAPAGTAAPVVGAPAQATPAYAGPSAGWGLSANPDRGATIAAIGGAVAAVGFFLPLIRVNANLGSLGALAGMGSSYGSSYGSSAASFVEISAATSANSMAVMWLTPILMVLAALVRFMPALDMRRRLIFAGLQMAVGFNAAITVLAYMSVSSYLSILSPYMSLGIGAYAMVLGQLAVFVGGLMSMLDSTGRLRGVR